MIFNDLQWPIKISNNMECHTASEFFVVIDEKISHSIFVAQMCENSIKSLVVYMYIQKFSMLSICSNVVS